MRLLALIVVLVASVLACGAPLLAQASGQPSGQPSLEGFTAVTEDQLKGMEQIPAAPLVIAAYAFVWVAVLFYVWLTWRRLSKVEGELQQLARKTSGSAR